MQVKKFEARTMKEALEMVKSQMGPDAIILSARDNNRSFGLVGEGSVEVTAAVSEETLHKKKFVESRMRENDLQTFQKTSARAQKTMIDKVVNKYNERNQPARPVTATRYIEIDGDDGQQAAAPAQARNARPAAAPAAPTRAQAAQGAINEAATKASATEIQALKKEIENLRGVITHFKEMPQNFTGTHPGADYGIPYDLSAMFEKLTTAGVADEIVAEILTQAQEHIPALKLKNKNLVDAWVARHVLETTPVVGDVKTAGKIQFFVGPAGGGKTTAMIKHASHLVVREGRKVALLTTDTFKVGATDQMRMYAQILNVPFAIIRTPSDWGNIMKYLDSVDDILVDSPGFGLKDPDEIQQLRKLLPPAILNPRIHFVASATSKDGDVNEAGKRYSIVGFDDVIFTGLDEASQHGTIYNFARRFGIPLHSFGIGPRVPEDFEPATRERVLDLLFKITHHAPATAEA